MHYSLRLREKSVTILVVRVASAYTHITLAYCFIFIMGEQKMSNDGSGELSKKYSKSVMTTEEKVNILR